MFTHNHLAPDYRIVVNGADITPLINARLIILTIVDKAGENADTLTLTLTDHDGKLELPPTGALVQAYIGWAGQPLVDKGTYSIDEIEHSGAPDVVVLSGKSANMGGTLPGQKSRSHRNTTLGKLVALIAGEHGLTPAINEALGGIRINHIDQTAESDLNLLSRLAQRYGAIATVKGQHLLFIPSGTATTASGEPLPPLELTRADIAQHRYLLTERDAYTGIKATWNSRSGGKRRIVLVGDGEKAKELRQTYASEAEAIAAATAELERVKRGNATLNITLAVAQPDLLAETPVSISGLKKDINEQKWVIRQITHTLGGNGLMTAIESYK